MIRDIYNLIRFTSDRKKPEFKAAPLWLVVSVNNEIALIKKRLNPISGAIKILFSKG